MEREGSLRRISRSLHSRLKLGSGSSSSLTDLSQAKTPSGGGAEKVALVDEGSRDKGTQQRRAGANATWNSIHNAVISVFQRKDLGENELFTLNEGVRHLLKTELGSFFTEYLQKQLLTKGMVILRDKIRFYEGQKLLDSLADTWDFFFCDVLSMVQAIFCPVQGKEPSVRQLALLHFRNIITLNLKLEEALSRPRARVPPSIIQMLLILQGVHESKGVTDDYLRLECLIQKVVSPYLGTHGLYSQDGSSNQHCSSCLLDAIGLSAECAETTACSTVNCQLPLAFSRQRARTHSQQRGALKRAHRPEAPAHTLAVKEASGLSKMEQCPRGQEPSGTF
ncbi:proline-rich protein 5-like isoform X4 [Phycodurus eques]|uniref:proline-rich protein 5-like isoform X4 n=1 Tax=Phycodurus eques TaxID=693459 RepID=UPI002ACEE391|nr:proline-rich protein 5-like isoform X4 [Phycodurus eques]